jgi:hypothetical protein
MGKVDFGKTDWPTSPAKQKTSLGKTPGDIPPKGTENLPAKKSTVVSGFPQAMPNDTTRKGRGDEGS